MKTAHFLSSDLTATQDLSAGALDVTFDFGRKRKLEMLTVRFSQAVSETITITLDSAHGSDYDVVLSDVVLVAETDYVYRPQGECNLHSGDKIRLQCSNVNLVGVAFAVAKTSEM